MARTAIATPAVVLTTNKLIRNTYLLLTLTLMTSAVTALIALATRATFFNPFLFLGVFIGFPFLIYRFRDSAWSLPLTFVFTGLMGYMLGPVLAFYLGLANGPQIVAASFGATGLAFFGLSGYALTTRRDFSFMGGFLMVGALVILAAILVNLFTQIPALSLTISSAAVILLSGLILFDTSRMVHGHESNYVLMTVSLYANIYAMFLHLLNLFAFFNSE